jgi:hypothetical protein
MKPIKGSKSQTTTHNKEYNIVTRKKDPYWDEGIMFHPKYRKGYKNPNKQLMKFQVRMYKTWKHNRENQYRNETKT